MTDAGSRHQNRDDVLEFRGVVKTFGSATALDRVTFPVRGGEIHALVGENGAGKSTLMRILAGDYTPDGGCVVVDGEAVQFRDPGEAISAGIGCVHQIPMFIPGLSVTENLLLGAPYKHRRCGLIDWVGEHQTARHDLAAVGLDLNPRTTLESLRPHERQLVAVARVLRLGLRVLVLDEVTASLSEPEVETLHAVIRSLAERGVAILYVSHRLEEIFRLADTITVLRDGKRVTTQPAADLTQKDVARLIVGQEMKNLFERQEAVEPKLDGPPRLRVRGAGDERLRDISFDVAAGEVVGIAGLGGAGRTRLLHLLYGVRALQAGQMFISGKPYRPREPTEALARGIALVTEDRQHDGFVPTLPIWQNITLPHVRRFRRRGFLRLRDEYNAAIGLARRLGVRMPSIAADMSQLSGGNQQKAIFARWISDRIDILLLDEPTHGVDVRSKSEIYDLIRELAADGTSIIVVSSELEEIEALCDRVLLLRNAELIGEVRGVDITKQTILHALLAGTNPRKVAL
ncbi:sugar ABC transporter ATP-binding protein [Bradyrhizobium sp. AUGA SZCCT0182]|uniref:sugar ABC transporter ATP-binding protein n=1 Tax=Bradyrhizobium sp. AUGA SZCCT0182 TaxID=2807667 RepID=UPI001BAD8187|nr:sugar ABC transporter ATP-binding protein [Bradyrhizobium sp. AUGA SZCCT0182]MBR1231630.1 sugar ABC transporter ATP-binding protein [Bradyrhizobium sp. AUGA SZCCT0182]